MVSKMQLHAVGEACPGYTYIGDDAVGSSFEDAEKIVSCETCIHWVRGRCNIDLFDKVLSSLDQT
ncbi:hypothetical protein [Thermosediminibacter oceani]|uniref:Uncharacterized protein n=1 Tax=Thermosediminibacter oceani (strain ATCC BAA-1034 / DSM 16646 / JW/IW-1228P) TaxID=555079 RepID=D9S2F4_THEOJ|nr:hypothetical protein [Thermosediminibacter oceani]ADL07581.1 conserved hypothetical protein [Thermosediminibacter oceani DSM 16646]